MSIIAAVNAATRSTPMRAKKPVKDWTTPEEQGGTDSTAIQAAIDTGLNVQCNGDYTVATELDVTTKTGQAFFGSGTFTLAASRPLGTRMFNATGANKVSWRGLTFDGNKANQTQPDVSNGWNTGAPRAYFTPIYTESANNLIIEGCEFHDVCTTSICFNSSVNVQIIQNYFHDSYMDAVFTNLDYDSVDVVIHRNRVNDLTYAPNGYANGFLVDASDLVITRNTIDNVDRAGMKPTDQPVTNVTCQYNTLSNSSSGFSVQAGSNVDISYNNVSLTVSGGIGANGVTGTISGLTVTNNVCDQIGTAAGATQSGILLIDNMEDVIVDNNTITNCYRNGIRLAGGDRFTITNNYIDTVGKDCVLIAGTPALDTCLIDYNDFNNAVEWGVRSTDGATNLTVGVNNTFTNMGSGDVSV
jgi:parallel beta-helix repeat protein